jgi:uncharacterized protein YbaR (Trm112 family)
VVIVFGWGQGQARDRGEVVPIVCPNCHNHVFLHEIQSNREVSLYFVPMASYRTDVYLACPVCRHGLQVDAAHRSGVDAMVQATRMVRTGQLAPESYRMQAERFLTQMGMATPEVPMTPPPSHHDPASISTAGSEPSLPDRLAGLAKLRADGILTDEEFSAAKRRLLDLETG